MSQTRGIGMVGRIPHVLSKDGWNFVGKRKGGRGGGHHGGDGPLVCTTRA
jgi:hypothetical protein